VSVRPERRPGAEQSEPTRLTEADRVVRTAAFRAILAKGRPWDAESGVGLGLDAASVRASIDHLVWAGRARTNERGGDTAAAGLSTEPTAHHVLVGFDPRWTNCAFDALGILGALDADGVIATVPRRAERLSTFCSKRVDRQAPTPCCSSRTSRAAADRTRTGARM
jgi:hypothetical protein